MLSGGALALVMFFGYAAKTFILCFYDFLERHDEMILGARGMSDILRHSVFCPFPVTWPGDRNSSLAKKPAFTAENIKPDSAKLSLVKGVKRIFGPDGIANLLKCVFKMSLVGLAVFLAVWPEHARLAATLDM